jgi:hypothetical protein
MANGRLTIGIIDFDGDIKQTSFDGLEVADGTDFDAELTKANALQTAVLGIVDGLRKSTTFGFYDPQVALASASDENAQAHVQWIAKYIDNSTLKVYSKTIGTADLEASSRYTAPDGKTYAILDLSAGVGLAFKTAFEAYERVDGVNTVTLQSVSVRE